MQGYDEGFAAGKIAGRDSRPPWPAFIVMGIVCAVIGFAGAFNFQDTDEATLVFSPSTRSFYLTDKLDSDGAKAVIKENDDLRGRVFRLPRDGRDAYTNVWNHFNKEFVKTCEEVVEPRQFIYQGGSNSVFYTNDSMGVTGVTCPKVKK